MINTTITPASITSTTTPEAPLTTTENILTYTHVPIKAMSLAILALLLIACNQVQAQTPANAVNTLNETDIAGLVWMLEEEKLAHDVYVTLFDAWGVRTFDNISRSEAQHMAAVQGVLERYNIAVPHLGEVGVFNDATLQGLYADLVARGTTSLTEALQVGAFIEELDIEDLNLRRAQTDNRDIRTTYDNLNRGSRNHLRAFVRQLNRYDVTYEPQVLEVNDYHTIINSSPERGNQN